MRIYRATCAVLIVGIIGYLAWRIGTGWAEVRSIAFRWDTPRIIGALVSALVAYQCLFLAWITMLRRSGHFEARHLRSYARIWWTSYLYRYVPGKVLVVVERARMGALVGIPPSVGAAFPIIETAFAVLAGILVSLLSVFYYAGNHDSLIVGVVTLVAGAGFAVPYGYRAFCRLPFIRKRFPDLLSIDLRFGDVLVVMALCVLHYLLLGTSFFLIGFDPNVFSWSDLPGLCGIYALSHVAGLVVLFAPGGLGVREGALSVQLALVVPSGLAEALGVAVRVWFTLIEVICYAGVFLSRNTTSTIKRSKSG